MLKTSFLPDLKTARRAVIPFVALSAICAMMAPASAQSLQDKRAQAAEEKSLQREADYTATICGTSIRTTIQWSTAKTWPKDHSIAKACDGALGAVEAMCRTGRAADVQEKIKSFQCLGDGSGPALTGGVFSFGAAPGASGFRASLAYLERQL